MSGLLHALVEDAAREAGCTVAQILGPQRSRTITEARWQAMLAAYEGGFSLPQIGRVFNRDHTTVLHAVRRKSAVNGLPYYKAYPRDFFEGTRGMDGELKGAYRLVLDLIYQHGGSLQNDERHIAGELGYSVRKWNSLLARLVAAGKLQCELGIISNFRATLEVDKSAVFQGKQRENGTKPKKIKAIPEAAAEPKANHTDTDTEVDIETSSISTARDARSHLAPILGDDLAAAFVAHRRALRKPMTPRAGELMARKLAGIRDPVAAAETSIRRGWLDVFEDDKVHPFPSKRQSDAERLDDHLADLQARLAVQRLE